MRIRYSLLALAATAALAAPAAAQGQTDPVTDAEGRVFGGPPAAPLPPMPPMSHGAPGSMPGGPDMRPEWRSDSHSSYPQGGYNADHARYAADYDRQREEWLRECRHRHTSSGLGGAAVGGVIGGIAGSGIAGRGNRTAGAVVGAVAGAVAGAAIERGSSRGRVNDECEAWLAQYSQPAYGHGAPGYGHGYPAYGYAHAVPMMMVPVAQQGRQCREVVTYEYVDVPVRRRVIHRRPAPVVRDKRLPMTPTKRVPM
jgi:hypothetical protein